MQSVPQVRPEPIERWARRTLILALALSMVVHACLILIGALVMVRGGDGGNGDAAAGGPNGPVEMAVMTKGELAALEASAADSATALPAIPDLPSETTVDDPSNTVDTLINDSAMQGASEVSDIGALGGGGELSGAGGLGLGGSGSGSGTGASFFGVEASGTRFAFLVDVSSSMEGRRMVRLQEQLAKSINGMAQNCSFFVVTFSTGAAVIGEKHEWREASESGKRWAKTQFGLLAPTGSTEPLAGLEIIYSMRPRPDAIYFMTDGEFNDIMTALEKLNAKAKVPIHCICLGSTQGEAAMKEIAERTKGSYKFVAE